MNKFLIELKDGRWKVNGKMYVDLTIEEKNILENFFKFIKTQNQESLK